jgi:hypothetical protein
MKALAIYEQPHAEWLGECYGPITPENMKEILVINLSIKHGFKD